MNISLFLENIMNHSSVLGVHQYNALPAFTVSRNFITVISTPPQMSWNQDQLETVFSILGIFVLELSSHLSRQLKLL